MTVKLYHHPYTRAANGIWMLEEVGVAYELLPIDARAGEQKTPGFLALNPMGKLPVLVDEGTVVTEVAAIALYLGDRYASGRLAPTLDDPARGPYLRWAFFGPSVVEPAVLARSSKWEVNEAAAGFGNHQAMLDSLEHAIGDGPWILGDRFTMVDIVLGGTMAWLLSFGMLEERPSFVGYIERLNARPARQESLRRNAEIAKDLGLG